MKTYIPPILILLFFAQISCSDYSVKKTDNSITEKANEPEKKKILCSDYTHRLEYQEGFQLNFEAFKIINSDSIGVKKTYDSHEEGEHICSENFIYLGKLKLKEMKFPVYVISHQWWIQAAIRKHYNSELIFMKDSSTIEMKYRFGLYNEIPIRLEGNSLVFKPDSVEHSFNLGKTLPCMICVKENSNCY